MRVLPLLLLLCSWWPAVRPLHISAGSYGPCSYTPMLQTLDCSRQSLTSVPSVDASLNVRIFFLDDNPIASIGDAAFANLSSSLQVLQMQLGSQVPVASVSDSALAGLGSLRQLTLTAKAGSESSMPSVSLAALLADLRSLQELQLGSVRLFRLPANSLAGAPLLRRLQLRAAAVAEVDDLAFANATRLQSVDLSQNSLAAAAADLRWLRHLRSLQRLTLSDCGVATLGQLPDLPLTVADFSSNAVESLPAGTFANVGSSLLELSLRANRLRDGQTDALAELQSLQKLYLASNQQLFALPPQLRQLRQLQLLDARGTRVAGVQEVDLHPDTQLLSLQLDFTRVGSVAAGFFRRAARLRHFSLSSSVRLDKVDIVSVAGEPSAGNWSQVLLHAPLLESLTLSGEVGGGGIGDEIWPSVLPLRRLRSLSFRHNSIRSVPDFQLARFPNLSFVDLSYNSIESVSSAAFYGLNSSASVFLQNNSIARMDNCTLAMFESLAKILLGGNPFSCGCELQWLLERLSATSSEQLVTVSCSQPPALAGRRWSSITDSFCQPGQSPPADCVVLKPPTPSTPPPAAYPVGISVVKETDASVRVSANVSGYADEFSEFVVEFWPLTDRRLAANSSRLPLATESTVVGVRANVLHRFCVLLLSGPRGVRAGCRDFTLVAFSSAAAIAAGVLAAIIGTALIFALVCILVRKLRSRQLRRQQRQQEEQDPYTYTYPEEKQQQQQQQQQQQFQAAVQPGSKRFSKRPQLRPSVAATSTTTLSRSSFGGQQTRPGSGHSMQLYPQQQQLYAQQQQRQALSRSTDQLSQSARFRQLPAPPRHARSQELVLDADDLRSSQQPPPLPHRQQQQLQRQQRQRQQQQDTSAEPYLQMQPQQEQRGYVLMRDAVPDSAESSSDPQRAANLYVDAPPPVAFENRGFRSTGSYRDIGDF